MISRRWFVGGLIASLIVSPLISLYLLIRAYMRFNFRPPSTPGYSIGNGRIELPLPSLDGIVSVGRALANRRSVGDYRREPLSLSELSQILWAVWRVRGKLWF